MSQHQRRLLTPPTFHSEWMLADSCGSPTAQTVHRRSESSAFFKVISFPTRSLRSPSTQHVSRVAPDLSATCTTSPMTQSSQLDKETASKYRPIVCRRSVGECG